MKLILKGSALLSLPGQIFLFRKADHRRNMLLQIHLNYRGENTFKKYSEYNLRAKNFFFIQ